MSRRTRTHAALLCAAIAIAVLPLFAQRGPGPGGPGPGFPPVGQPQRITDKLYWLQGGGGNTAIYVAATGVVLVDTKVANNGQAILDRVRTITDKPVTHILNTHTHGDHVGSNAFFPASVEIVVQENTAKNMRAMPAFAEPAARNGLPDRTFADKLTVLGGADAIDLYHFGPAHTDGDAFIVFRDARVMHAGDLFATKGLPGIDSASGGSGLQYGETIDKAAKGIPNVTSVIAGHSDALMTWQDFVDFGEFNRALATAARAAARANKTAEQAAMEFRLPARLNGFALVGLGGRGNASGHFGTLFEELRASR